MLYIFSHHSFATGSFYSNRTASLMPKHHALVCHDLLTWSWDESPKGKCHPFLNLHNVHSFHLSHESTAFINGHNQKHVSHTARRYPSIFVFLPTFSNLLVVEPLYVQNNLWSGGVSKMWASALWLWDVSISIFIHPVIVIYFPVLGRILFFFFFFSFVVCNVTANLRMESYL